MFWAILATFFYVNVILFMPHFHASGHVHVSRKGLMASQRKENNSRGTQKLFMRVERKIRDIFFSFNDIF